MDIHGGLADTEIPGYLLTQTALRYLNHYFPLSATQFCEALLKPTRSPFAFLMGGMRRDFPFERPHIASGPKDNGPRRFRGGIASPSLRAGSSGGQLPHQALLAVNFHIRIKHAPAHPFLFYSFLNGSFARRQD
jgi:hypothetical protein